MKRWSTFDAVSISAVALSAAVTGAVYGELPRRMATHFDGRGVANGFMPRAVGAWLLLALALFSWSLVRVVPVFFPRRWRERALRAPMPLVACLLTGVLVGLHFMVLDGALRGSMQLPRGFAWLLGLFWIALSLVVPRVRRNPLVGIRTPWTLASDENWARTHHLAGYTFAAGGVVAMAAGFAGALPLCIAAIVTSALAPAVYSFLISGQESH
jgi:uncharacterized membrane protein